MTSTPNAFFQVFPRTSHERRSRPARPRRSDPLRKLLVLTTGALCVLLQVCASASGAAPRLHDPKRVLTARFADPAFAKFGGTYYLYRTGPQFSVTHSTNPFGGYSAPAPAMRRLPAWVGRRPDGSRHTWGPDVFSVRGPQGRPLYVMYFSAYYRGTRKHPWGANCIGIATSHNPAGNFVATRRRICANSPKYEAIDPTMYRAPGGARYLVYKRHEPRSDLSQIRAMQMGSRFGMRPLPRGLHRTLAASDRSTMEATSLINHSGRVWLFVSRGNWKNCSYATETWSARSIKRGRFTRFGWLMTSASTGLCGRGSATVLQDGAVTRVAFAAWNRHSRPRIRNAWIGMVRWNPAQPVAAPSAAPG
ncbi:MAG TPA: family 43 glycosylhydrolase [Jatrophihabitans sp.]|nr:family 43 glycosylhydrolase [Jatrophihabitans sp.]